MSGVVEEFVYSAVCVRYYTVHISLVQSLINDADELCYKIDIFITIINDCGDWKKREIV